MRADMRGSSSAAARSTNFSPISTCAPVCMPAVRSRPIIRARTSSSPAMLTSPIVSDVMLQTLAPEVLWSQGRICPAFLPESATSRYRPKRWAKYLSPLPACVAPAARGGGLSAAITSAGTVPAAGCVAGGVVGAVRPAAGVACAARTMPSRNRIHSADSCAKFGCDGTSLVPNSSGWAVQNARLVSALASPCPAATSSRSAATTRPAAPIAAKAPGPPPAAFAGGRTAAASSTSSVPFAPVPDDPVAGTVAGPVPGAAGVEVPPPGGTVRGILLMMLAAFLPSSCAS